MRTAVAIRSLVFSILFFVVSGAAFGQVSVGISVGFAPPALPVYEQPICPGDGYIWTPGYWAYGDDDYYWVPGTWIESPQVGFLWTPGYWGWGGSAFFFHEGYWGPHVGFYGGVSYGYGYFGNGYEGGRWDGGHFFYNRSVNNVNVTVIHNTYNATIVNRNETRVSYNGGNGGVEVRETEQDRSYANERHVGPVPAQTQHVEQARSNRELRASVNQGKPPIAATSRPGDFKTAAVPAREAGAPYKAPEHAGNEARPENNAAAHPNPVHANEVDGHKSTPPNTGNPKTDKKYQQQQDKMVAKQNQDHQKLQQQQEKEHQQATKKNYNDAQKQQMEQRHSQQTQQLEQKHTSQQQQMETHQAPASHPAETHPSSGGKPH
jgi:WXXGXW repeat (2 copies)